MFGLNWSDPQTLWLNIINLSLGLVTLVCIAAIGYGIMQDVRAKSRKRAAEGALQRAADNVVSGLGGHAFDMPGLGLTMADGGEPLDKSAKAPKSTAKTPRKTGK
jgi:hypothetical protein